MVFQPFNLSIQDFDGVVGKSRAVESKEYSVFSIGHEVTGFSGFTFAAAEQADGFVFGSPVYYAHPSGRILSALDRVFYAGSKAFAHKPGAAVAVARRGGTSTTFDVLNKHFTINQMPVVASTYWNNVFGCVPGEADGDAEGLATMRNIGKNMVWLLRCIEAGKAAGIEAPEADRERTNFIR